MTNQDIIVNEDTLAFLQNLKDTMGVGLEEDTSVIIQWLPFVDPQSIDLIHEKLQLQKAQI